MYRVVVDGRMVYRGSRLDCKAVAARYSGFVRIERIY